MPQTREKIAIALLRDQIKKRALQLFCMVHVIELESSGCLSWKDQGDKFSFPQYIPTVTDILSNHRLYGILWSLLKADSFYLFFLRFNFHITLCYFQIKSIMIRYFYILENNHLSNLTQYMSPLRVTNYFSYDKELQCLYFKDFYISNIV